jgi:DNA-3-methyladenine glycosylase
MYLVMEKKLDIKWYEHHDVVEMARLLLGKILCSNIGGELTKGIIVETEAYSGENDKACHANGQKMTKRNEIMFAHGGHAYVYLCYGIHHLFNIVTNTEGKADAVLIRALEPIEGIETMLKRRNMVKIEKRLTSGPGVLAQAMGIKTANNKTRLDEDIIWIEEGDRIEKAIISTTRIGVEYAEEDALKPWRFYISDNKWVSKY